VLGLIAVAVGLRLWTLPFVVRAAPAALTLHAGDSATVAVLVTRNGKSGPVRFIPVDPPGGITVTQETQNGGDDAQFRLAADLNMNANPRRTIPIAIQAEVGANRQTARVALTVEPPAVTLPPGFVRPRGARLVRVNDRIYPDRISRDFPDGPLVFLLIGRDRSDDPDPFFIMEDKVSNGLFARFAAEHPAAVKDSKWTRGGVADGKYLTNADERLPVLNVSAKEAHAFAGWLGGRLPTCKQWDKAAGLAVEDHRGRTGPFEGAWDSRDPDQIAVGREKEGPLPVGRKTRDVSPFGCRDMAGNGLEWTRDSQIPGHTIPPADERADSIITRGRRYSERSPLTYAELGNAALKGDSVQYLDADPELGFRVVIEIAP
jgi:formylglycine-generating enzyme required for sulfatase activity